MTVAIPALAHHASQAEFDKNSPKTISGVLTRVQWTNPHVRWYIDIKNEKTGEVENLDAPGHGPGPTRRTVSPPPEYSLIGKTYTAMIAPARDGSNGGVRDDVDAAGRHQDGLLARLWRRQRENHKRRSPITNHGDTKTRRGPL